MSHLAQFIIISGDNFGHRQRCLVTRRLLKADSQILAHPIDSEAKIKLIFDHGVTAIDHLPGLCRAA